MPKKPSRKGRQSKSERIHDLPMNSRKVKNPDQIVGGGTAKGTAATSPQESISLNFGKIEYK